VNIDERKEVDATINELIESREEIRRAYTDLAKRLYLIRGLAQKHAHAGCNIGAHKLANEILEICDED